MASVNSQKEDGKSDASKRKESSGVDRWDYRDYPDIVIDDSLNDRYVSELSSLFFYLRRIIIYVYFCSLHSYISEYLHFIGQM